MFLFYQFFFTKKIVNEYKMQFAYAVTSIDPSIYDDWESAFIGNHIFYRLLPEPNRPFVPYLTKYIALSCDEPESIFLKNNCKRIRIMFKPINFRDCNGRSYETKDILYEFEKILSRNNWIIPSWKKCGRGDDTICITGKYLPDQARRIKNIYFRFGWSKANEKDKIFGSGPYCLQANKNSKGQIISGTLSPRIQKFSLPQIHFHTSQMKEEQFHLALYGTKNLLNGERKNIQMHTPLAYYVITHPKLDKYQLPWNTMHTKNIIHEFFVKNEMFFSHDPKTLQFTPKGEALLSNNTLHYHGQLVFALPNYLPDCQKLATMLNKQWRVEKARAVCVNIVDFVYNHVINVPKNWDGILVGISPSDPGRGSLRHQYFSPNSSNSWTYKYASPDKLFYQVGIGKSFATVDGKLFCNIRPNPLGISDIFITDLLPC